VTVLFYNELNNYKMKKYIYFLYLLLMGLFIVPLTSSFGVDSDSGSKLEFKAEDNIINLGTIYADETENIRLEIEFENIGNQPLELTVVRACCRTNVIDWTKGSVQSGETGIIEVRLQLAKHPHNFSRTVVVFSNESDTNQMLLIRGTIAERDESSYQ